MNEKVIAVVGPTATGKTELGIKLAQAFDGEIVNADAYQIYKHLDIVTAKPTQKEQEQAIHHLIDIKEVDERFSAFEFMILARETIKEIQSRNKLPIIVGGSGFFLQSLLGDRVLPEGDEEVPQTADIKNRIYDSLLIGLNYDSREELYDKINQRVDLMYANGMMEEVNDLYNATKLQSQSSHAIGYSQFDQYFNGVQTIEETIDLIKRDSRHYAKRQITFFKNQFPDIKWFDAKQVKENVADATNEVKKFLIH